MTERRAIMVDRGLFGVFVEKVGVFASMGGIKLRGLGVCVHVCAQPWPNLTDWWCGGIDAVMEVSFW